MTIQFEALIKNNPNPNLKKRAVAAHVCLKIMLKVNL